MCKSPARRFASRARLATLRWFAGLCDDCQKMNLSPLLTCVAACRLGRNVRLMEKLSEDGREAERDRGGLDSLKEGHGKVRTPSEDRSLVLPYFWDGWAAGERLGEVEEDRKRVRWERSVLKLD